MLEAVTYNNRMEQVKEIVSKNYLHDTFETMSQNENDK